MKVSVAIITFNHERFISQAIDSVLSQKVNFEYELIIGEDCSTDGTRAIAMDFYRRYPDRIKLLPRERNIGGFLNIESTLAACHGEYLAILEGDDYWTATDKLQKQVDFLDAHPQYALCCHRTRFLRETGGGVPASDVRVFPSLPSGSYTIEDLLKENFIMTCSALLRRALSESLPSSFSKTKIGDWPRFIMAARHGRIQVMDDVMAVYRVHSQGTFSSMSLLARLKECTEMLMILDECLNYEYTNAIQRTLAAYYLDMASIMRENGKRFGTARYVFSCIRNGGWKPGRRRCVAGLATYALIGSWYRVLLGD
jgi:glycosyltransferase involved in cell wall biosynthesis